MRSNRPPLLALTAIFSSIRKHSIAMVALRSPNLVWVEVDPDLVVMGMLVDRRDELGRARTQTINRLHRLLLELFPGGAKRFLSSRQARALIATIKPRDIVGKTRRRLVVELIVELEGIDKQIKAIKKELKELVIARGSTLQDLHGIGPSSAGRLLADVGDIHRFVNRDRFASWNGTAPLEAPHGSRTDVAHRPEPFWAVAAPAVPACLLDRERDHVFQCLALHPHVWGISQCLGDNESRWPPDSRLLPHQARTATVTRVD